MINRASYVEQTPRVLWSVFCTDLRPWPRANRCPPSNTPLCPSVFSDTLTGAAAGEGERRRRPECPEPAGAGAAAEVAVVEAPGAGSAETAGEEGRCGGTDLRDDVRYCVDARETMWWGSTRDFWGNILARTVGSGV